MKAYIYSCLGIFLKNAVFCYFKTWLENKMNYFNFSQKGEKNYIYYFALLQFCLFSIKMELPFAFHFLIYDENIHFPKHV